MTGLKTPLLLTVEDDEDLADVLGYNLSREGFEVQHAPTGAAALAAAAARLPDLVLLDVMLPDLTGFEVCRRLRAAPESRSVPILMLTARGEELDRVVGFEAGADDYVVKPFSVRELTLRVRALLRRAAPHGAHGETPMQALAVGSLRLEATSHRVWVADVEVSLTALEFRLLSVLLERRGRVQSREQLLRDVWDIHADVTTRTVDTHVRRLRQKLGAAAAYIETLRGVGYRMCEAPPDATPREPGPPDLPPSPPDALRGS